MNPFDHVILTDLSQIIHNSPILTKVIVAIYDNGLVTGFFVALLWGVWFDQRDVARQRQTHEKIIAGLIGSVICVVIVRIMAILLPFRHRPLTDPSIGFKFPITSGGWEHWSSFPSDNAALFFLLTVCLFSISRKIGWIALFDAACFVCFPRIFVGVHYPTDVVGGAVLGVLFGCLVIRKSVRGYLAKYPLQWLEAHPPSFYGAAFFVTFLFASVFWPVLSLLIGLKKLLYMHPSHPFAHSSLRLGMLVAMLAFIGWWGRVYWKRDQKRNHSFTLH